MRLRRLAGLGAAACQHQHHRLCGVARAPDGGKKGLRTPDLLAVQDDHAGGAIVDEKFKEIGAFEARLVAGRDHIGERNAAAVGGTLEVAKQAAALADEGDRVFDAA